MARFVFGTDGIRAIAPDELNFNTANYIARAIVEVLHPEVVYISQDTRQSSDEISKGLLVAFKEAGLNVIHLGVLPTAALAIFCKKHQVFGVMVSASHNPYQYNGIKIFNSTGEKISEDKETAIEEKIEQLLKDYVDYKDNYSKYNFEIVDKSDDYIEFLKNAIEAPFGQRKIVLDCANGAAYKVAPLVLRSLGINPIVIFNKPDGKNINYFCGATHLDELSKTVKENKADLGVALDGDADRMIAVDETGEVIDGDYIVGLFAADLKSRGLLSNNKVVVTVMTNMAFYKAMKNLGIDVVTVNVGDKYVLSGMRQNGAILGGESSGHIIRSDFHVTGDGILTALLLLELLEKANKPLSVMAKELFVKMPQVIKNIPWNLPEESLIEVSNELINEAKSILKDEGRVVIRMSGTEPVVRIMVEAKTESLAFEIADLIGSKLSSLN